jgi:quinol monooxygenase YgiN
MGSMHRTRVRINGSGEAAREMIQSIIKMTFAQDTVGEGLGILRSIVERIRAEAGCIGCYVYHDAEEEQKIIFVEKWRSEGDLTRHLRSREYQKILLLMEMALAPPDIRFDTITSTSGVETIEKARTEEKE